MKKLLIFCLFLILAATAQAQKKNKKEPKPKGPWYEAKQPVYADSDLGRVFRQTVDLRDTDQARVYKPISIRVGDLKNGPQATVIYDTETLRMAAAIPDRFLMFNEYRNGLGGAGNWVGAPYMLQTRKGPGFARDGSFEDPREKGRHALPKDWATYKGNYRYGDRVILSYAIHGVDVLESPWLVSAHGHTGITRGFEFGADSPDVELLMNICSVEGAEKAEIQDGNMGVIHHQGKVTAVTVSEGVKLIVEGKDTLRLSVNPRTHSRIMLRIYTGEPSMLSAIRGAGKVEPLSEWIKGGPAVWTETLVTKGTRGADNQTFAVDAITPPFDNPYKALFFIGGHDFFSNGDAAVSTIHGDVWRVSGIDDTLEKVTWKRYATGLFQPLGLKIVDDQVYVLCRDEITRLHDLNGDNEIDFYESFNSDCKIGNNVHEYATGLDTDPAGNFYYLKGIGSDSIHSGTAWKVSADGKTSEIFATGFRWPNGSGVSPTGEFTAADQQGGWVPSSRLDIVKKGGFYGHVPAAHREVEPTTYDGPLCWIPHGVDNSCGGQTWVQGGKWGGLDGHMVHLSYGKCDAFLVLQEQIRGVDQAGVVKLPIHFSSGAMRARFNPNDGQLYVSGLKGWQTSGAKDGCFERVRYTGKTFCLPVGLNAHANGMKITFNQVLDTELVEDLASWKVEQWQYRWTKAYGSKDYKISDPETIGRDPVVVKSAKLLPDGKSVFLDLGTVNPVMQMGITYDLETVGGDEVIGAVYNTIHAMRPAL